MKFKRLISFFTSIVLSFSCINFSYAEASNNAFISVETNNDFIRYNADNSTVYAVEGGNIYFNEDTGSVIKADQGITSASIPSKINGIDVVKIDKRAFNLCSNLSEINIPNSVKTIEYGAFSFCTALKEITIPNSVETLGAFCFSDCSALTKITLSNKLTSLENRLFQNNSSLSEITLPETISSICDTSKGEKLKTH